MFKNTASQKLIVFAFDSTTNLPKSGDAANLTAYVGKDYGTATVLGDTSATEIDATNAKGYYLFDLTQTETNADTLHFTAKSSTANIVVIGVQPVQYTIPASWIIPSVSGAVGSVTGAVGSVTGTVGGNVTGSVGSISGITFPTNFSATSIDASGRVDIGKILGTASAGTAGYMGLDWGHITAPTTTVGLTNTTISTSQLVASVTGAVGSVTGSVGSVVGSVGSVTGLTASNLDATVSSRMATYTQPTGFLAATFPSGTIANTSNITTVGAVSGSVGSVVGAVGSVTGAVGSVTGNVGGNLNGNVIGNVSGSVGSVTGSVGSVAGSVASVVGDVGGNVVGSVASVAGSVGSVAGDVSGNVNGKVLGGGSGTISGDGVRAVSVTGAVGSVTGSVGSVVGSVGSVVGLTVSNLDVAVSTRASASGQTAISTLLTTIDDIIEADQYTDTGVVPWAVVHMRKGTGGIGVGVELMRKKIYTTDGTALISTDTVVGRTVQ